MSATYGKWRTTLTPKKFAESLLNHRGDPMLPSGMPVLDQDTAWYVLDTYVEEGYMSVETAHEIFASWVELRESVDDY